MVNIDYQSDDCVGNDVMMHLSNDKAQHNNSNTINSDRNDNNVTKEQDRTKPCETLETTVNGDRSSKSKVWGWLVPGHPSNPQMKVM